MTTFSNPLILTALELEARPLRALAPVQVIAMRARLLPHNLAESNPSCIILAGLAGALDPTLDIADLIVDDPQNLCPPSWPRGPIHTSSSLITSPKEKSSLYRQTHALAVDMENALVRRAAADARIPFIGLRAISDTADQSLDPEILSLTDDQGRIRSLAVSSLLIRRPWIIPELKRLKRDSDKALAALTTALNELLTTSR